MALVQSRQLPEGDKFTRISQVVRALRGAVADEMSAQNLYSEILDCLKNDLKDTESSERIRTIMEDEMEHAGSLLYIIGELDNIVAEKMQKGASNGG